MLNFNLCCSSVPAPPIPTVGISWPKVSSLSPLPRELPAPLSGQSLQLSLNWTSGDPRLGPPFCFTEEKHQDPFSCQPQRHLSKGTVPAVTVLVEPDVDLFICIFIVWCSLWHYAVLFCYGILSASDIFVEAPCHHMRGLLLKVNSIKTTVWLLPRQWSVFCFVSHLTKEASEQ